MKIDLVKVAKLSAGSLLMIGTATFASSANACGGDTLIHATAASLDQHASDLFHRADYDQHSIVGFWSFTMTPTSGPGDFGFQQWHSDGTELMNSGGRAPASENICMGAWRSVGPNRYHLNHLALSYDPTSGQLNARVNIKEDVSVDATGNSYSGSFTLDVYDPTGKTKVASQQGQVTAQRIHAN
ncbi:hypothetical protein ABDK56_11905 [Sphingomonas sp. ASV193]|uniref:hypothetical protein n=1 Tax=Sphingomonas sp. ASV193 TaxID=3144405 RepID=UPI0032E8D5E4